MKHLRSRGEFHVQLLAELILESCMGEVNDKFFDMWKRMLKKDVGIDLGKITIPQLIKELKIKVDDDVEVVISGIESSTYKISVWHPTYTLITSLE